MRCAPTDTFSRLHLEPDAPWAHRGAASKPVQPMGVIGLFKALGEPEVHRALGLLVAAARRFGRDLH